MAVASWRVLHVRSSSNKLLGVHLSELDSDSQLLYFEKYPAFEIFKSTFVHNNQTFVIDYIDSEDHEIPLGTTIRQDILDLHGYELDPWDFDNMLWDLSDEDKPYDGFDYDFQNHSGWNTKAIPYYTKNIPNVKDGSIIGFYWLPITSILH